MSNYCQSVASRSRSTLALAAVLAIHGLGAAAQSTSAISAPMTSLDAPAVKESALHMISGRSMTVKSALRLSRVYVSNPAVLDSYTVSPWQILLTAKAPGTSSVILRDLDGGTQIYTVSSDIGVEELRAALRLALTKEDIHVEASEGRISLSGTVASDAAVATAIKLAELYSKDVANSLVVHPEHVQQVELKVRIVEVDRSKIDEFGINFISGGKTLASSSTQQFSVQSSTTTGGNSSGGSGSSSGGAKFSITDPLNLFVYNTGLDLGVAIKDLENRQVLQILAEPNITTLSGKRASFLAGGEFPFPVVQGGTGGFTSVTIQFRPYGVKLEFTPIVNADGTIHLEVAPEVSALDYTNAVTISGYTIPAIATRRAETQVELKSGQSFLISGLLDHRTTEALGKVPGPGDLPVLGSLFRSKGINRSVTELMVVVTPTLVYPLEEQKQTPIVDPQKAVPDLDVTGFDKKMAKEKVNKIPATTPSSGSSH